MARLDLRCRDCKHAFALVTRGVVAEKRKCCPECGSTNIRQTLGSYLENGPLSSPICGAQRPPSSGFG